MRPHTKVRPRLHSSLPALPSRLPEGEQPLGVGPGDRAGGRAGRPEWPQGLARAQGGAGPSPGSAGPPRWRPGLRLCGFLL